VQKRLIPNFHYALKAGGFLLLGSSETVGSFSDLFAAEDKTHRIYSKKPASLAQQAKLQPKAVVGGKLQPQKAHNLPPSVLASEIDAQKEADRVTIARFAPGGVL